MASYFQINAWLKITILLLQTNHSTESMERKERPLEEGSKAIFRGSTALLVELEDKVAQTAADVQNAQSEVGNKQKLN